MNVYITVDQNHVVKEVVAANIAAGFLLSPRSDIQPGDVLTDDEKIIMGLIAAPEGYVPPSQQAQTEPASDATQEQ